MVVVNYYRVEVVGNTVLQLIEVGRACIILLCVKCESLIILFGGECDLEAY